MIGNKSLFFVLLSSLVACQIAANVQPSVDSGKNQLVTKAQVDVVEAKDKAELEVILSRGVGAIKRIIAERDKYQAELQGREDEADMVAKEETALRAITMDLEKMCPGDGDVWVRLNKILQEIKILKEERKKEEEQCISVPKIVGVSFLVSVVVVLGAFGLKPLVSK
jgi:hypothetical protein